MSRLVAPSDEKFDFQYVKRIVNGQQNDIHMNEVKRKGWEAVMAKDYPDLGVGVDDSGGLVILGGMILMRKPKPAPAPKPVVPKVPKPKDPKYFASNKSKPEKKEPAKKEKKSFVPKFVRGKRP